MTATKKDALLLPRPKRVFQVKGGSGGFGQSNVCYVFSADGQSKPGSWMKKAIAFVEQYDGPNLMLDHSLDETEGAVERLDAVAAASGGQGFVQNAKQRSAVEKLAMRRAMEHFKKTFPSVQDVCDEGRSYDIHCQKGQKELWVEVKGTTGDGRAVFLTRLEYELAKKGNSALYVLHSIRLSGNRASGGKELVLLGWDVSKGNAIPVAYKYELPSSA